MLAFAAASGLALAQTGGQADNAASKAAAAAPAVAAPGIEESWDSLIQNVIPQARVDPALVSAPAFGSRKKNGATDFLNHLFFETRTEYDRYSTSFTGNPTVTSIVNAPFDSVVIPGVTTGIGWPPAFEGSASRVSSFVDLGTRGWLSDRINTHFALRYRQDLDSVSPVSPAAGILETYSGRRLLELDQATVEVNGKPTDGFFANTQFVVGRQYVYGAEVAALDGAQITFNRARYALTLFGGRRFSYYSDPLQRATGGGNLVLKLRPGTSVELESLFYVRGSNSIAVRHQLRENLLLTSYFRVYGGAPVDFSAQALYSPGRGRTTMRVSFFQKLSNKDYFYDYTSFARDRDQYNSEPRLYLGPPSPYSQVVIDARREISRRVHLGGTLWVKRLNSSSDQGPFDTSFTDYRLSSQVFALRRVETFLDYHQRNSDRLNPFTATTFDDIRSAGETSVKDLQVQLRRNFGEGRVTLTGGAYYRRVSLQDRFLIVNNAHQSGWTATAWLRLDQRTRLFADYNLDNDFFVFRPDLSNSRMMRLGVRWKY